MSNTETLLEVRNLKKHYPLSESYLGDVDAYARAVDGISFELRRGETLGIVGESGCGKSTAATSMIRLEEPTEGEIIFDGEDITSYSQEELNEFRRDVQMIFQDPDSSFNPRMSIGKSIAEPLIVQGMTDEQRRREIVADLLERVNLSADDMNRYPHEFSGGQKQRIGLARALTVNPKLLVADEPVSALDVSIQSEVLGLLKKFQRELDLSILLISHDLGVVREICDRVAVMYLGEFVEVAPTEELFSNPQHPYTEALISAIPTPDPDDRGLGKELKGDVPSPAAPPSGCRFHTRCPSVIPPEGIDLPQDIWRNVLHFRKQVIQQAIDLDTIAEVHAIEADQAYDIDTITADTVDPETLKTWVRDEYEIPRTLTDESAEQTLSNALDTLVAGNTEQAAQQLNEQFTTVCEREKPSLESAGPDHRVACHLHEQKEENTELDFSAEVG